MIETFGTALALVPLILLSARNGKLIADVFEFYFREKLDRTGQTPWARVRPMLVTLPVQLIFPGVWRQWQFIEEVVLPGDDATAEQFRLSYVSDCNMTSVAVRSPASPSAGPLHCPNQCKVPTLTITGGDHSTSCNHRFVPAES